MAATRSVAAPSGALPSGAQLFAGMVAAPDTLARMVDACNAVGILPYYGPFGDIADLQGCEDQFRAAFILGCVGAWSLHPSQVTIAKQVFSPPPAEVLFAKRIIEAMGGTADVRARPDGPGAEVVIRLPAPAP